MFWAIPNYLYRDASPLPIRPVLCGQAQYTLHRAQNLAPLRFWFFNFHPSIQALRAGCAFLECREAIHTHSPIHPHTHPPSHPPTKNSYRPRHDG
jgi:hypothetical protein